MSRILFFSKNLALLGFPTDLSARFAATWQDVKLLYVFKLLFHHNFAVRFVASQGLFLGPLLFNVLSMTFVMFSNIIYVFFLSMISKLFVSLIQLMIALWCNTLSTVYKVDVTLTSWNWTLAKGHRYFPPGKQILSNIVTFHL